MITLNQTPRLTISKWKHLNIKVKIANLQQVQTKEPMENHRDNHHESHCRYYAKNISRSLQEKKIINKHKQPIRSNCESIKESFNHLSTLVRI